MRAAARHHRSLEVHDALLRIIVESDEFRRGELEAVYRRDHQITAPHGSWLTTVQPDSQQLLNTLLLPEGAMLVFAKRGASGTRPGVGWTCCSRPCGRSWYART